MENDLSLFDLFAFDLAFCVFDFQSFLVLLENLLVKEVLK